MARVRLTNGAIATGLANGCPLCSIHIVLTPCIVVRSNAVGLKKLSDMLQGYNTIANELLREPETIRSMHYFIYQRENARLTYLDTLFYPLWIQANAAGSSAKKYRGTDSPHVQYMTDSDSRDGRVYQQQHRKSLPGREGS